MGFQIIALTIILLRDFGIIFQNEFWSIFLAITCITYTVGILIFSFVVENKIEKELVDTYKNMTIDYKDSQEYLRGKNMSEIVL